MITVVLGGQFGSEGKGSVVSWLAKNRKFDLAIRTGGPNAGHTFYTKAGELFKMRQLPCSWDAQPTCPVYVPSGGILNRHVFGAEVHAMHSRGFTGNVLVSENAAVIDEETATSLEADIRTGTTGEGIGGTRALKCLRKAKLAKDYKDLQRHTVSPGTMTAMMDDESKSILVETSQGYGLSLDGRFYPFVTSTNLNPYAVLSESEVPWGRHETEVWMVLRTFPIRIAGNSGPLYGETNWSHLQKRYGGHIPEEQTTVTKKTRRVGEFDVLLAQEAMRRCQPDVVVLTFFDYLFPETAEDKFSPQAYSALLEVEQKIGHKVNYVGVGIGKLLKV